MWHKLSPKEQEADEIPLLGHDWPVWGASVVQTGSECPQLVIYFIFFPCGVNSDINNKGSWNDTGWCKTQREEEESKHIDGWFFLACFFFFLACFFSPLKLCVCVHVCVCDCVRARVFKGPFHLRSTSWYWVVTTVVFSGSDWPVVN